jgi:hypothetical protein
LRRGRAPALGRDGGGRQPARGAVGDLLGRSGLREEVGRHRHEDELLLAAQRCECLLVELYHAPVGAADDQQRGCLDLPEPVRGEVRATTTGDHRPDVIAELGGGAESGGGPGRGPEVADSRLAQLRVPPRPAGGGNEPLRQQADVEDPLAVLGLGGREQVVFLELLAARAREEAIERLLKRRSRAALSTPISDHAALRHPRTDKNPQFAGIEDYLQVSDSCSGRLRTPMPSCRLNARERHPLGSSPQPNPRPAPMCQGVMTASLPA